MAYVVQQDNHLPGAGLQRVLPGVSNAAIEAAFGVTVFNNPREKYQNGIVIKSLNTGYLYKVYTCFGEWRIGGIAEQTSEDDLNDAEAFIRGE